MTDLPNKDDINDDIRNKEDNEDASQDIKRMDSEATFITHKNSDIDNSNINKTQEMEENILSDQKQKSDNLRKRFLFSNQVQG